MKQIRKPIFMLLLVLMAAIMSVGVYQTRIESAAVKLNKKTISIQKGKNYKLKVLGTGKKIKWSSSSKKVATVSKKGIVTGKSVGKATIRAKVGKKVLRCKVTVKKPAKRNIKNLLEKKILKLLKKGYADLSVYAYLERKNGDIWIYNVSGNSGDGCYEGTAYVNVKKGTAYMTGDIDLDTFKLW